MNLAPLGADGHGVLLGVPRLEGFLGLLDSWVVVRPLLLLQRPENTTVPVVGIHCSLIDEACSLFLWADPECKPLVVQGAAFLQGCVKLGGRAGSLTVRVHTLHPEVLVLELPMRPLGSHANLGELGLRLLHAVRQGLTHDLIALVLLEKRQVPLTSHLLVLVICHLWVGSDSLSDVVVDGQYVVPNLDHLISLKAISCRVVRGGQPGQRPLLLGNLVERDLLLVALLEEGVNLSPKGADTPDQTLRVGARVLHLTTECLIHRLSVQGALLHLSLSALHLLTADAADVFLSHYVPPLTPAMLL